MSRKHKTTKEFRSKKNTKGTKTPRKEGQGLEPPTRVPKFLVHHAQIMLQRQKVTPPQSAKSINLRYRNHIQIPCKNFSTQTGPKTLSVMFRSGQSTVGGPKCTKIDLFRPKWTILVHFGPANAKIRFGIRSFWQYCGNSLDVAFASQCPQLIV